MHGPLSHKPATTLPLVQGGPDPEVMEFISKIGQIIVKARTVSSTIVVHPIPALSSTPATATAGMIDNMVHGVKSVPSQQQNLELALQDMDLWKSNTPVHVNILHPDQHVLLERWVISYTPAAMLTPMSPQGDPSSRNTFAGLLSPKAKLQQQHYQQQGSGSLSPSSASTSTSTSSSSAARKDTTDLVLLLQSLYTQIRSLPLQNCLTSFDEKTKLTKTDLAYSITSAHEEITHVRQHSSSHHTQRGSATGGDENDDPITDPAESQYAEFASSLKSTLPLEFVQSASLKVINFEASHIQWGCVRVTGMYDESVGNRIDPKDFQDLTNNKVQKKHSHRSSKGSSSSALDSDVKLEKRKHKAQQSSSSLWTQRQPVPASAAPEIDKESGASPAVTRIESIPLSLAGDVTPKQDSSSHPGTSSPTSSSSSIQRPSSPAPSPQEQLHARLQSLKRNSDRLFSSLSSSRINLETATRDQENHVLSSSVLQESLLPKNDLETTSIHEKMHSYNFPPASSPQSIPQPKRNSVSISKVGDPTRRGGPLSPSLLERTPTSSDFAPPQPPQSRPPLQYSPPYSGVGQQQHHHHSYHPFSTSPLAHVITRRRSSRLSIVMNCNDDSPDPTRPQSPSGPEPLMLLQEVRHNQDDLFSFPNGPVRRRASFQGAGRSFEMEGDDTMTGPSPPRPSFLRRSSLNPVSSSHGDLFGSLVGSYEESILSGRMSTLPSKPLIFMAQIGALANQDYKDCPPKLRCPKHVQLEFPAVFYDYDSSSRHRGNAQPHQTSAYSSSHSHSHSMTQSLSFSGTQYLHQTLSGSGSIHKPSQSHSFSHHASISPSFHTMGCLHSMGSFSSSPVLGSYFPHGGNSTLSHGSGQGSALHHLSHAVPTTQDDPILPYVGNLDLDSGFRGSRRFARMQGGMRLPLRGQVQVMIKNPNKTVVKVFLVPYDFTDMPPGSKTFLRQKHYSTGPGMGPSSTTANSQSGGTLRYAIHLQFCCPAPGYVYLYRSIRVVFANRVPDGKESLRVVLEGLGLGSKVQGGKSSATEQVVLPQDQETLQPTTRPKLEERYVKMRKGEVPFISSKRKIPSTMTGLGLDVNGTSYSQGGTTVYDNMSQDGPSENALYDYHHRHRYGEQSLAQLLNGPLSAATSASSGHGSMDTDVEMVDGRSSHHSNKMHNMDFHMDVDFGKSARSLLKNKMTSKGGPLYRPSDLSDEEDDDYKSIPSSVLIGTPATLKSMDLHQSPRLSGTSGFVFGSSAATTAGSGSSVYSNSGRTN
ncbi:hypothetical protein BGZ83_007879 [Gryganskiella cystojenkinii]|nr:hypothetical protein BGZ83_007879 [Gryganskiella cystojenkinii]